MTQVARLNEGKYLVGYRQVKKVNESHVVVPDNCDLPVDGSYRWDGERFIPRGHGYGKPSSPPMSADYAMFLTMRALLNDKPIPPEVQLYVTWYEENLAKRNEELSR